MKTKSYLLLLVMLVLSCGSVQTFAQNEMDENEALQISLSDLFNLEVLVASKTSLKVQDAPGIVTAYNRSTIDQMGYNTLADLANITPGYSSYTIYGERVFETRAQKAGSYDNHKHLLLIDGIPVAHARANKALTEEELPLYFADKVEFLRGPGSALYGTSAFFGVVNITPKELLEPGSKSEVKASLGSFDSAKRVMANIYHTISNARLSVNLGYYDKDASKDPVGQIDDPLYVNYDDQKSSFFRIKYKRTDGIFNGLEFGTIYLDTRGGLGEFWMHTPISHEIDDITWETLVPYLRFERQLNDALKLNTYLKYNRSSQFGVALNVGRDSFSTFTGNDSPLNVYDVIIEDWEAQAELHYDFSSDNNLIAGINYDTREQSEESFFYRTNVLAGTEAVSSFAPSTSLEKLETCSIYTQYQHRLPVLEGLLITCGGRLDIGDSEGAEYEQFSPRIALVQMLTEKLNLKYLFGQALRSPGLKEAGLNQEIGVNLPSGLIDDMEPEIIKTNEVGLTYSSKNILATLTLFSNRTTDTLERVEIPNAPTQDRVYQNVSGTLKAEGFEVEVIHGIGINWRWFANYSYAESEDADGFEFNDVPSGKANLGLTYLDPKNTANLIIRYIDGFQVSEATTFKDPGSYEVVDLNIVRNISKSTSLEFQLKNLFDEDFKLPKTSVTYAFTTNEIGDVPIPSRHFLFSINIKI